jgi:vacuolar-type H+-ATPase subunit C/Vma6
MKDFLFLAGQIRALESKLVTQSQLDRMIGASSPEDAFRVLIELSYAQYFDEQTRPQDFEKVIERGILETKELILNGTENAEAFELLWKQEDLNNLKRALKLRLVDGKSDIGKFEARNGFSLFGSFSAEEIQSVVFGDEAKKILPAEYAEAISQAESLWKQSEAFQDVEFALDVAHFNYLSRLARKTGISFIRQYARRLADSTNLRALLRNILLQGKNLPLAAFVPQGTLPFEDIKEVTTLEAFKKVLTKTVFFGLDTIFDEKKTDEENLLVFERAMAKEHQRFLTDSEEGEIGAIQIPLVYMEKRLRDARLIKFIMFAKFYGMDPEKIYETIRNF